MRKNQWLLVFAIFLLILAVCYFQTGFFTSYRQFHVAVAPKDGIRILSENPVAVEPGSNAVFQVEIQDGYTFSSASAGEFVDGVLTVSTVNSNRTIYFDLLKECRVSVADPEHGTIELQSPAVVNQGDVATVVLDPDENYTVEAVYLNGVAYLAPTNCILSFPVTDDTVVDVSFSGKPVDVTLVAGNLGYAAIQNPKDTYCYGDALEISCEFDQEHISFEGWSINGYLSDGGELVSDDPGITFVLDGDTILYANFLDNRSYVLTYNENYGKYPEEIVEEHSAGENVVLLDASNSFAREGWTLLGFDTVQETDGEPATPGAMFRMPEEDTVLYAQWIQNTPDDYLVYQVYSGNILLKGLSETGLANEPANLVIPSQINGMPVVEILGGAFESLDFLETVVLPTGLRTIHEYAFADCENLHTVYFSETLGEISKNSFANCDRFSNMRVIASTPKVFDFSYDSALADKYMQLACTQGRRIVLVGGSNLSFGLDSSLIKEAFPEYSVINMGVSVNYGILTMFDILDAHVREGDIVIFCPEYDEAVYTATKPSTIANWLFLESNYDILKDIDLRNNEYLLTQYVNYLATKKTYLPGKKLEENPVYSRYGMNIYGDLTTMRDAMTHYTFQTPEMELLTEDGIGRYNELFKVLSERGAYCCFSFPANPGGDTDTSEIRNKVQPFYEKLCDLLDSRYVTVISQMSDYFIPGFVFYDSPYHLSIEGAKMRTNLLISDLSTYLEDIR